jgi:mycobactin salicyl-AMP ligase
MDGFTPWPESFQEQYLKTGYWQKKTLAAIIENAAARWPRRIAVRCNDQSITYAELHRKEIRGRHTGFS